MLFDILTTQCQADVNDNRWGPPYHHTADTALITIIKSNASSDIKNQIIETALDYLDDEDQYRREAGAEIFATIDFSVVPSRYRNQLTTPLINLLEDSSVDIKTNALFALAGLASSDISSSLKTNMVEPLLNTLEEEDIYVKGAALLALAHLAESDIPSRYKARMVEPVIEILRLIRSRNNSWFLENVYRIAGLLASSNIPPELKATMITPLIDCLPFPSASEPIFWSYRKDAAWALAELAQSNISTESRNQLFDQLFNALGSNNAAMKGGAERTIINILESNISEGIKNNLIERLTNGLENGSPDLRLGAYLTISSASFHISNDLKTVLADLLIAALGRSDSGSEIRERVITILTRLSEQDLPESVITRIREALQ
jgi:HEAT repeat protein